MDIKKLILNYWKSIVVIASILYLSFASPSTFKKIPTFENLDKIVHIVMYLGLASVLIYEYRQHKKYNKITISFVLICLILPISLGGIIELMQEYYFPPRSGNLSDWIANVAGVGLGWLGMQFIYPLFGKAK